MNQNRLKNQFLKLVKIDSISKHEANIMGYLVSEFSKLGLRATFDQAGKYFDGEIGNLFVSIPGKVKSAPKLLLNAHVDTVTHSKKIKPIIKRGVIYSDGTTILGADDKAGVVAIMELVRCLKENNIPHGDIHIVLTVAEEIGLHGSKAIDHKKLKADFGFVLDGGRVNGIVNQAPSQDNIVAKIHGRAAHAGTHPEDGISSIKVASSAIAKMKLGRIDFETTANIGLIKGGKATNIVPDLVEIKGEARSHNAKKLKKQMRHMTSELSRACSKAGAKLNVKVSSEYRSFKVGENQEVMQLAKKAAKSIGIQPITKPTGGGSDANIFNASGIPSVIIGLGARNLHTIKENIPIQDLVRGTELLLQIVKEAAQWTVSKKKH
ncbi:MAG: M20/M25/M40 family metallo-hydrolase [Candidatus Margulisbacteria bacterium]|nr:M20/M25/M40 family metallo-hydrolase [Candidatus Margulisiibacteriota bacterium]MBU1021460.1 M20/M25/M40 family metallo-hydrolase [Candidatus Margulisiibacteriota bacterium]MBU1728381.1 M20/M25/M40 family metallo-hydrolase [Candidatus Margulisiibacteriota bacterium]MBU1955876.1 M20/M25/M40 family metallo-hydrolase [Candidatus Margulisiibacteriota bacterium]